VGGSFGKATVFAMGVMPYISASIIIQLLATVFPYFHKLQRKAGRQKKNHAIYPLWHSASFLYTGNRRQRVSPEHHFPVYRQHAVIPGIAGPVFTFVTAVSLTTGTVFIMWLGEQITNRGIGNGISFIIFIGIVDRIPTAVFREIQQVIAGTRNLFVEIIVLAIIFLMTAFIVLFTQATRRIPSRHRKKWSGLKCTRVQNTVLRSA